MSMFPQWHLENKATLPIDETVRPGDDTGLHTDDAVLMQRRQPAACATGDMSWLLLARGALHELHVPTLPRQPYTTTYTPEVLGARPGVLQLVLF